MISENPFLSAVLGKRSAKLDASTAMTFLAPALAQNRLRIPITEVCLNYSRNTMHYLSTS